METILIQDADDAIADIVITALRMKGYRAGRLTEGPEDILENIRSHRAKLILLDSWLVQQSAKLCGWIKAHFPELPVIAFSSDLQMSQHFRALGFDGYLSKPFELEDLYSLARRFLPGRRKNHRHEK